MEGGGGQGQALGGLDCRLERPVNGEDGDPHSMAVTYMTSPQFWESN